MKVLVANQKYNDIYFGYQTLDELLDIFYLLFRYNDENNEYYDDLTDSEKKLYDAALKGDKKAAFDLLTYRKNFEYERWNIFELLDVNSAPEYLGLECTKEK